MSDATKAGYGILIVRPDGRAVWYGCGLGMDGFRRFRSPQSARAKMGAALCVSDAHIEVTESPSVVAPSGPVGPVITSRLVTAVCAAEMSDRGYASTKRTFLVGATAYVVRLGDDGSPVDADGTYAA